MNKIVEYYDMLIEDNNDPVLDDDKIKKYMDNWDGKVFIDNLNLSKDKTVLEIEVGTGRIAQKVVDKCKHFTGIDLSPKTIERAQMHFSLKNNIELLCIDLFNFESKYKYDIIYSSLTFIHIKNKNKAIKKIYDLLLDNGRFVSSI